MVSLGWPAARQASWLSTGEAVNVCSSERASALLFFVRALFIQKGARKIDTRQPRAPSLSSKVSRDLPFKVWANGKAGKAGLSQSAGGAALTLDVQTQGKVVVEVAGTGSTSQLLS
ncbi:hypothetical protein E2C01_004816 [Portunus trituberculatus]|uniref:Uncharacterized protein n=1 Tax=Portunus trituberculatus TaxID=210409 RepID=A0A5B7CSN5_PORTR|nr:hypothetical protein [Portunus trituberculatus]